MILRELRQGGRRLMARPGYTALSVGMLGVGLGILLFLFSLIDTLILQPLPFPQADRLLAIGEMHDNGVGVGDLDSGEYLDLHGRLQGIDQDGAYASVGVSLDGGSGARFYSGTLWTSSLMDMLGVQPLLGRPFSPADDVPGAAAVALVGETLWRHEFHADPGVIGRAVRINGEWTTIVGVLPAAVGFPGVSEVWQPLRPRLGQHDSLYMVGRLRSGVSLAQAREQLSALDAQLRQHSSQWQMQQHLIAKPLSVSFTPEDMRRWVWLMFAAAALVLLLACVNVANLQLVQTLSRRRELALRSALGSSRGRLMLGVLMESLLLSVMALAVALPIVYFANRWIVAAYFAADRRGPSFHHFGISGGVLVFAIVIAVVTTALAGLIPAWRASHTDMQDALREGSKGSGGAFARVAKALVVMEIVLTVVLLVGAGTFVRSLNQVLATPAAGAADATHVLTARVALPPEGYAKDAQRIRFFDQVATRLRSEPGVLEATVANTVPGAQLGSHETIGAKGQSRPASGWPEAQMGIVDAHFLDTYGVRLLEGRFIDPRDRADSQPVTVIDRKTALALWPGQDAVGQSLVLYPDRSWTTTLTVVGVIEPLQLDTQLERSVPGLLVPLSQAAGMGPLAEVGLAVRTRADPATFEPRLTAIVRSADAQAAVHYVRSQARLMSDSRISLLVLTQVFTALGLVALMLAAAGLYGVLAFSVAQRTREFGIRRAIGAGNAAIVREVGRQLLWQLTWGLGLGLVLAWPWSGLLADPGLHTQPHDLRVFAPVLLMVLVVSVLSALVPLYRALRVDPAMALRYE